MFGHLRRACCAMCRHGYDAQENARKRRSLRYEWGVGAAAGAHSRKTRCYKQSRPRLLVGLPKIIQSRWEISGLSQRVRVSGFANAVHAQANLAGVSVYSACEITKLLFSQSCQLALRGSRFRCRPSLTSGQHRIAPPPLAIQPEIRKAVPHDQTIDFRPILSPEEIANFGCYRLNDRSRKCLAVAPSA